MCVDIYVYLSQGLGPELTKLIDSPYTSQDFARLTCSPVSRMVNKKISSLICVQSQVIRELLLLQWRVDLDQLSRCLLNGPCWDALPAQEPGRAEGP